MYEIKVLDFNEDIISLRLRILHPGGPDSRVRYETDKSEKALHLGIFDQKKLIACGSLLPEDDDGKETDVKNRIRGMAVEESHQGKGLGALILRRMLDETIQRNIEYTWCNAREAVLPFYEREGFRKTGSVFDVPGSGSHYKMTRSLKK